MCLNVFVHQSEREEREERDPCILDPDSGLLIYNPFEPTRQQNTPRRREWWKSTSNPSGYHCPNHAAGLCDRQQWQICRATDTDACLGWQNFHFHASRDKEFDLLSLPVYHLMYVYEVTQDVLGNPIDADIPYFKVRQGLFDAGSKVGSLVREIVTNKQKRSQGITHLSSISITEQIEHDLGQLRTSLDELKKWTSEWEAYAEQGKMEACPAKDITSYRFASYVQVVPGTEAMMSTEAMPSPNQLLKKGAGIQPDGPMVTSCDQLSMP
ncbi:hypothetical protein BGZ61DRAFT_529930 [Ilyonectria robusta]|uniref:uncharacterized protein n=1 Tax=Ilyonectria robusta TaxID=1079257 RepID=UPI001E8EE3CB|nr:uncharacterized protein BGZ61DRAFT_529930 [Ilyonectria robusta]KAH8729786.1 hypothetical protein BGZ61DRAFT_529930 [Ilyonectria robusta]